MNNKVKIVRTTAWASLNIADGDSNYLSSSGIDALCAAADSIDVVGSDIVIECRYIPQGLGILANATGTLFTPTHSLKRQDFKTFQLKRLPQPVDGQGLCIVSNADSFERYFRNSWVISVNGVYIRCGECNFTATEATNPFNSNESSIGALFSFFEI